MKSQSALDVQSHNWNVKVLDFASFRGSYVREFELSHGNLVNRIIKITHAHNLHMKIVVIVAPLGTDQSERSKNFFDQSESSI